jgi:glycosyltransferase involved in cell wall biosynthesis
MSRATPVEFAVIVPCYNEEGVIRETVAELRRVFAAAPSWELVVVNDGSSDRSREILEELAAEVPDLEVVHHERNRGYGAALKTGIRKASADLIVITDADGTYPNERLPEFVELAKDADMVVGARTATDVQYPFIRKIPKLFLRRYASWLAGQSIPDINSGMRVFRKSVAERFFKILPDTFSFTMTITLSMLTNRYDVRFVPIGYKTRIGKSKIKPIRDTLRFCQLLVRTGMYFAPLRVLLPLIALLTLMFWISIGYDVLVLQDLTEKSLILLMFAMNTAIFALLADMIDKRSP